MHPTIDGIDRLCVCGHNIWDHEDADRDIHECNANGCTCLQFKDADDNAVIDRAQERK